jgi:rare lipoprotein A (peptidoglycan hydrolase)
MQKIFLYIVALIFLVSCSSSPRFTSTKSRTVEHRTEITTDSNRRFTSSDSNKARDTVSFFDPPSRKILFTETGIASYYAEPFNGRKTANGETYNMYGLTAAHPSFPLGTIARVTNLKNGKTAIIKINDRMPKRPDRIIDLSYGTAIILNMVKDGITKVKIEVLKWGDNKYHTSQ